MEENQSRMQEAVRYCQGNILGDLSEAYHSAFELCRTSSSSDRLTHLENISKMLHLLNLTVGAIADK